VIAAVGVAKSEAEGLFKAGPFRACIRLLVESRRHRNRQTAAAAMQNCFDLPPI
jgi:hypothetical protein